jgi:hypothetical protein
MPKTRITHGLTPPSGINAPAGAVDSPFNFFLDVSILKLLLEEGLLVEEEEEEEEDESLLSSEELTAIIMLPTVSVVPLAVSSSSTSSIFNPVLLVFSSSSLRRPRKLLPLTIFRGVRLVAMSFFPFRFGIVVNVVADGTQAWL